MLGKSSIQQEETVHREFLSNFFSEKKKEGSQTSEKPKISE